MSEFTQTAENRISNLINYAIELHSGNNGAELIKKYQPIIDQLIPSDLVVVFDRLMQKNIDTEELKSLANKILNVFYKSINEFPAITPAKDSFLDILVQDNAVLYNKLMNLKPEIKRFNKQPELLETETYLKELSNKFVDLQTFTSHYTLKENALFPVLEKEWKDYRCVQLMWSYHDDIRRNLKWIIDHIQAEEIDLKKFNRAVGDLFFAMFAIIFREDKILFPTILETIDENILVNLLSAFKDIKLAYTDTSSLKIDSKTETQNHNSEINLGTGSVNIEQLKMIFNHLPVDITYVDENDEVKYFSTPKHRIFPRTIAVIGRKVHHCHPPESVHIVEKIVESFKNGEKDEAAFWIKMGTKFILIKYFAVRNEQEKYKGVLEVSQEVSEIRALQGERRLLNW